MFKKICVLFGLSLGLSAMNIAIAQQDGYWQQAQEQQKRQQEEQRISQERQQWEENNRNAASKAASITAGSQGGFANAQVSAPPARNQWGAFAIDAKAAKFGHSENHRTQLEAEEAAMYSCGSSACKTLGAYANQCGTLSFGGGYTYFHASATSSLSEIGAIKQCKKYAKSCVILITTCSI